MTSSNTSDLEIVSIRVFDAPRELVWRVWSDPKHLAQWWGPNGFTSTFSEFDFRPGGQWNLILHAPDGMDYKNKLIFLEIDHPRRIVMDHVSGPHFEATATFDEQGGKTKVTFRMVFKSAKECEHVKPHAAPGNEQMFDRMAALLATLK